MTSREAFEVVFKQSRYLPLLPLLYLAWGDGELTPTEIRAIRDRASRQPRFDADLRAALAVWLDPDQPPSATVLLRVLRHIRLAAREVTKPERLGLMALSLAIAGDEKAYWQGEENQRALSELVEALDVAGNEATREILGPSAPLPPPPGFADEAVPNFEIKAMQILLDGPHRAVKERVRHILQQPMFTYQFESSKEEKRAQVFGWLQHLADRGLAVSAYPKALGGEGGLGDFIAVFETLACFDQSLVVKFGVQFGLFGGSIYFLGTQRHHRLLADVAAGRLLGCYAMTEFGHGSNVRDLQTTATYDRGRGEWIIHTPHEAARKEWIGGAAKDARMATVYAQLLVDDESHGVHAFLVPIRDEKGRHLPGVKTADCGHKMGLNGVDNGRLWFDHVRIPRENLLNRYADVTPEGVYTSPIASAGKRFFTMLSTLVGGRVSIACAALSVSKTALAIAVRYAAIRRQFGSAGQAETAILDYPAHQQRLMPRLATAYALSFALGDLVARYTVEEGDDRREFEAMAAALKAYATRFNTDTLQTVRECCGGQGFLSLNRIPLLMADSDIYTTFEGDNTVLLQLVAKSLLTAYRRQFADLKFMGILRFLAERTSGAMAEFRPIDSRRTGMNYLRNGELHLEAFRFRETHLLYSVASRLRKRIDEGLDAFTAFNQCQMHLLSLGEAHAERLILESFVKALERVTDSKVKAQLETLCHLFGLARIEAAGGWYQEQGFVEGRQARAIRKQVDSLCREVRGQALHLVKAFGIPDPLLAAPIADPNHENPSAS